MQALYSLTTATRYRKRFWWSQRCVSDECSSDISLTKVSFLNCSDIHANQNIYFLWEQKINKLQTCPFPWSMAWIHFWCSALAGNQQTFDSLEFSSLKASNHHRPAWQTYHFTQVQVAWSQLKWRPNWMVPKISGGTKSLHSLVNVTLLMGCKTIFDALRLSFFKWHLIVVN